MKSLIIKFFGNKKKTENFDFAKVNSILLKPIGDAIGDAIIHTAHLRQIRDQHPHIKLGVFVTERNRSIYESAGFIDSILTDKFSTYLAERNKWDLYLDFMPSFTSKSLILDKILSAKYVVNFGKREKKYYNLNTISNFDVATLLDKNTHIKDYLNQSVLSDFINPEIRYSVSFSEADIKKANKLWTENKVRILINPHGSKTELPPEELSEILNHISSENLEKIQFIMTNTNKSAEYLAKLSLSNTKLTISLAPTMRLTEYFALISSSDIVLATDGGGIHIACACNKTLLAFYANHYLTNMWAPYMANTENILLLVGGELAQDASATRGFDVKAAYEWLNNKIAIYRG